MWTTAQYKQFELARRLKNKGYYKESLAQAEVLLCDLHPSSLSYAYVSGCVKAVDLWHMQGKVAEADELFSHAFNQAIMLDKAIAAYILNDWSSTIENHHTALEGVRRAIDLLLQTGESPDPDRRIEYDLAYLEATRARIGVRIGIPRCLKSLTRARRELKKGARALRFYRAAYFNVLGWECEAAFRLRSPRLLLCGPRAASLAFQQGKLRLIVDNLRRSCV
jgi:hypothetical protein